MEVCRCLARTHHGRASVCCHCGAGLFVTGRSKRHFWALAKVVLVVGGRHSGPGAAANPHGHQTLTVPLLRLTCTREVLRLAGAAGIVVVENLVMALVAVCLNVRSVPGCWSDSDCELCPGALGRRPRWVAAGCLFVVLARDGCATFGTDWMGHWRPAVMAGRCCVDQ